MVWKTKSLRRKHYNVGSDVSNKVGVPYAVGDIPNKCVGGVHGQEAVFGEISEKTASYACGHEVAGRVLDVLNTASGGVPCDMWCLT